ncbi:uncharacterized protein LOC134653043 isoform X1 [Cydia amplana]|uniref:uncharacterized protein LOC134653043 isoform X1 n=1 Tax=Cydia amplana TaxID=1869771 RepID=UPI002FE63662
MVRLSPALLRVPVIKFRKGGLGHSGSHAAPAAAAAPAASPAPSASCAFRSAGASQMSTSAIPDIDLPARYRRKPLSQEEIDQINGGGIKEKERSKHIFKPKKEGPLPLATIKIPRGVLVQSGKKKKLVSLSVTIGKQRKKK